MKTTRPRRPVADPPPRNEPHGNPRSTNRNPRTHDRRSVLPHIQDGRRRLPPRTVPGPDRNPNLRDCLHGATQRMVRRLTKHEVPRHARRNGSRPLGVLPDCRSMERDVSAQLRVPKDEPPPVPHRAKTRAITRPPTTRVTGPTRGTNGTSRPGFPCLTRYRVGRILPTTDQHKTATTK